MEEAKNFIYEYLTAKENNTVFFYGSTVLWTIILMLINATIPLMIDNTTLHVLMLFAFGILLFGCTWLVFKLFERKIKFSVYDDIQTETLNRNKRNQASGFDDDDGD